MTWPVALARVRTYCVTLRPERDREANHHVSARSRSGACYAVWLGLSEGWPDWGFGDFLREMRPAVRRAPPVSSYDYIRESYGLDVKVGQRVAEGVVAEPAHGREIYVYIFADGSNAAMPFHPNEVHP